MARGGSVEYRFEIERIAGSGGMSTVYRAIDRTTGEPVAIKTLRATERDIAGRFAREIQVLASLRHPGIVRYVDDGETDVGELWLAMEWLEGESLQARLRSRGLTATESIDLARRVSEALGAAHERGIVHRDVKPSNIFLPENDLERVKILDFGVSRFTDRSSTRTGIMIGTPGYMSPEQVRGEREVTARADVFAVGCVLFECLTGRVVFEGENVMAVLAKIILDDPPRLSELRPDLPEALDELLARVLSRDPAVRPRDGSALAAELAAVGSIDVVDRPRTSAEFRALTTTEQRLLSVVLIASADRDTADRTLAGDMTMRTPGEPDDTTTGELAPDEVTGLRSAAEEHDAQLERLADGSYVVTLTGTSSATDQAVQAARCALALKAVSPASPMALATGRGVFAGRWPVGEAIDRAVKLLGAAPRQVRLDDVTAGLLDTRFEVGGDEAGLYLIGERDVVEVARTVLGKPTPCVGRDREIGVLRGLFEECVAEPIARAAVVTGAAGIGKTRVRYELLRQIKDRPGEHVEIWIGRGDPLRAGSPFGMIAPALRRAAGILDGEPVEVRRQKLRVRVLRNASTDMHRTTQFLGELVGAPFPDDETSVDPRLAAELRAARQDPMLMVDQINRAFEHFLGIETAAQPVVIVLEDMHWGDLPTTKLIDSALRALPDRPWFVLVVARPELAETFPRLWSERGVHELRLDALTRKGSERLIKNVLGDAASAELVARLVDQAGGNAFYLEELIRAVAVDPTGAAIPETVLAVVQSRLERLEVDARRVLRAASVFGHRFWRGGITALLGGAAKEVGARAWLDELVERELVARSPTSRFPAEDEFLFRHAMVREAAYAMLTEADRRLGHKLAGNWLARAGEGDALVLAEHFERGGDPARAAEHYLGAAEQALAACDFAAVVATGERGVACGARGELLGALRVAQAEASKWAGDFVAASRTGIEAMALLRPSTPRWFAAAGEAAEACGKLDDVERLVVIGQALRAATDEKTRGLATRVAATAQAAFQLFNHGNYELAQVLLDRVELSTGQLEDPGILARIHQARSSRAMFRGDAGAYLESEQAAAAAFERAGDLRYACMQHGHVGYACLEIGAYAEAERYLREALESGTRLGLKNVVATAKHNLGRALQQQGRLDEARQIETEAVDMFHAHNDRRLEGAARVYLSYILVDLGDLDGAEREVRLALETVLPPMRPPILASLARLLLARDRPAEALELAREASTMLDELGGVEEGESLIRLMLATTLDAVGELHGARAAIKRAYDRLRERAECIKNPEWRKSFLERIPENSGTLALAQRLLGR